MGYTPAGYADGGSYTFHFPDGNATIARLLVRNLIPAAVPGHDCRDVVTAPGRLRASSTGRTTRSASASPASCVRARNTAIRPPRAASRSPTRAGSRSS